MTADIIIPFHGRIDLLRRCIEPLLAAATVNGHCICLVDDCSSKEDVRFLSGILPSSAPVRIMRMQKRSGFVGAVNYAWSRCNSEIGVILNSDTVPGLNLVSNLLAVLRNDKKIAAVAPASDNAKDLFQFRSHSLQNNDIGMRALNYSFTTYLTAMCLAIRRSAVTEQWLFDPTYAPGYFEDLDLCCRLRQNGWKLAILESERIHHEGAATFGHDPALDNILHKNYSKFSKRWGYLPEHQKLDVLLCQ